MSTTLPRRPTVRSAMCSHLSPGHSSTQLHLPLLTASAVVAALGLLLATGLLAQGDAPVTIGTRVRFRPQPPSRERLIGTVVSHSGDSLVLARERDTLAVPLNGGTLEVSQGRHSALLRGLGLGLLAGMVVGGAVGAAMEPDELLGRGVNIIGGMVVGGSAGLVVGTVVGASISRERWGPAIPLRPPVADDVSRQGRLLVGLSLHF